MKNIRERVQPQIWKNIVMETQYCWEDGDELEADSETSGPLSEDAIIQAAIAILEARPNGLKFIPASPQGLASLMRNF